MGYIVVGQRGANDVIRTNLTFSQEQSSASRTQRKRKRRVYGIHQMELITQTQQRTKSGFSAIFELNVIKTMGGTIEIIL